MERVIIALAAFFGGVASGYLGFLESGESWSTRKYLATILRSLIAAILFAVGYHLVEEVTGLDVFFAFLGGGGVDHFVSGATGRFLGSGSFPVPKAHV